MKEVHPHSNKKELTCKMIDIWNEVFQYSIAPINAYVNKQSEEILVQLYTIIFKKDFNKWREYACQVNSSQFLMGEKKTKNNFKASFSWLIKVETIDRIQNGEYGVGDRELDMNNVLENIKRKKEEVFDVIYNKVLQYVSLNVEEDKERNAFEQYVKTLRVNKVIDEYGILRIIKNISHYVLFQTEEYSSMREVLYENYLMCTHGDVNAIVFVGTPEF